MVGVGSLERGPGMVMVVVVMTVVLMCGSGAWLEAVEAVTIGSAVRWFGPGSATLILCGWAGPAWAGPPPPPPPPPPPS